MKGRTKETEYQYEKRAGGLTLCMSENRCHKVSASALPC